MACPIFHGDVNLLILLVCLIEVLCFTKDKYLETKPHAANWPNVTQPDDDDSWMIVEPQYIDQLLADHMQSQHISSDLPTSQPSVDNIASNINQFVHKVSNIHNYYSLPI